MYRVTLKPGHPRGIYRRGGREFTREPVEIAAEEMTEEILNDPWLVAEEAEEPTAAETPWPEPATELVTYIKGLEDEDIDELQDLLEWEKAKKQRKSVLEAAEERMSILAARADPTGHEPSEEAMPLEEAPPVADHQED